mmetsp:Transcript_34904/g.96344  ORF Transcript_34904/g.96344 Transcript_34904/m.96344 type:complete len:230 (+) Transcript_34904:135-824(+)
MDASEDYVAATSGHTARGASQTLREQKGIASHRRAPAQKRTHGRSCMSECSRLFEKWKPKHPGYTSWRACCLQRRRRTSCRRGARIPRLRAGRIRACLLRAATATPRRAHCTRSSCPPLCLLACPRGRRLPEAAMLWVAGCPRSRLDPPLTNLPSFLRRRARRSRKLAALGPRGGRPRTAARRFQQSLVALPCHGRRPPNHNGFRPLPSVRQGAKVRRVHTRSVHPVHR